MLFRRSEKLSSSSNTERVPITKPAECLGQSCEYFSGQNCESRMELLEANGVSGGRDLGPFIEDSTYALYGRVCTGGDENVVMDLIAESPNGEGSPMELIGRMGRLEGQTIILTPR